MAIAETAVPSLRSITAHGPPGRSEMATSWFQSKARLR
jgi:hypothetical protein